MFVYRCVCWSLYLTLSALFFVHHKTAIIFNLHVDRFLKTSISFDSDKIRIKEKSVFFDNFRNGTPSKDDCRMNSTIKQIETDFSGFKLAPILYRNTREFSNRGKFFRCGFDGILCTKSASAQQLVILNSFKYCFARKIGPSRIKFDPVLCKVYEWA